MNKTESKLRVQLMIAVVITFFGMGLITAGFVVPPLGYINPTVLAALGEVLTFAGSLIGVDYHYKFKERFHSVIDRK